MASPLDGIAKAANAALGGVFYPATLQRDIPAAGGTTYDPAAPTQQSFACRAIVEGYSSYLKTSNLVKANERKVLILAASLSTTPKAGDRVTVNGTTFTITEVDTDPATAVWQCKGEM